ncbi:MAG: hypothetical protein MSS56_06365 [Spirochaetia bacterium]|nr:hypothetical protein [Spirochaetia bacterium]
MGYSLENAFAVKFELERQIIKASANLENEWFFSDGAFTAELSLESNPNTWLYENFVVIENKEIVAYFEGKWTRPVDIISGFRLILFNKKKAVVATRAFFEYLNYLFEFRGCNAFNWIVAEKNVHAYELYEHFIKKYFGHRVGKRHYVQKSYSGKVSDGILYEITKEEYFGWKNSII